jgi:hypothetical protein
MVVANGPEPAAWVPLARPWGMQGDMISARGRHGLALAIDQDEGDPSDGVGASNRDVLRGARLVRCARRFGHHFAMSHET